jgi:hypothetical protein
VFARIKAQVGLAQVKVRGCRLISARCGSRQSFTRLRSASTFRPLEEVRLCSSFETATDIPRGRSCSGGRSPARLRSAWRPQEGSTRLSDLLRSGRSEQEMFVPDVEWSKCSARCECQQSCSTLEHMGKGHEVEIQVPRDAVAALRQEYGSIWLPMIACSKARCVVASSTFSMITWRQTWPASPSWTTRSVLFADRWFDAQHPSSEVNEAQ